MNKLRQLTKELEETKWAIEENERRYNVDKAAELRVALSFHSFHLFHLLQLS